MTRGTLLKPLLVATHLLLGSLVLFLSVNAGIFSYRQGALRQAPPVASPVGVQVVSENKGVRLPPLVDSVLGLLLGLLSVAAARDIQVAKERAPRTALLTVILMMVALAYVNQRAEGLVLGTVRAIQVALACLLGLEVAFFRRQRVEH